MRPSLFLFLFIILLVPRLGSSQALNSNSPALDIDLDNSKYTLVAENPIPKPLAEPIISIDIQAGDSAEVMRKKLMDKISGITIHEKQQLLDSINRDFDNFSIEEKEALDQRLAIRKAEQDKIIQQAEHIKTTTIISVPIEKLENSLIEAGTKLINESFDQVIPREDKEPKQL